MLYLWQIKITVASTNYDSKSNKYVGKKINIFLAINLRVCVSVYDARSLFLVMVQCDIIPSSALNETEWKIFNGNSRETGFLCARVHG